ncbi:trichothecene 15-O-acetyltransferase [Aspergillus alliaceus]|uniref:Trichothecene 15-O-acetyltransferase n=1 Tax=Petromyces alliaceus TaxID=209559 RepID=A0A8H6AD36_PETAA|nr:trichothecene 15-O-acetyltransferase [Aspergillus burnettii]
MGDQRLELPPLSPEAYRWERSSADPLILQRRGNGAETTSGTKERNAKGDIDIWTLIILHVHDIPTTSTLSLVTLEEKLQAALLDIRFEHPEVACTALWDNHLGPLYQYVPPKDSEDALAWAQEAIQVRATSQTGNDIRLEIEKQRKVDGTGATKSVTIYAVADVADKNVPLIPGTSLEILIHMNHLYWDGKAVRLFAGDLVRKLSQDLSSKQKQYKWGEEVGNLSVPVLDAMNLDMCSLDGSFDMAQEKYARGLLRTQSSWGLKFKLGEGTPCAIFHNFTVTESKAIISALKRRFGPKYTITHLGQAAVVLALLKANPPPDYVFGGQSFITVPPVDGRRWLRENHVKDYYGICLTGAVIEFEDIGSLMVDENDKDAVIEALGAGCRITKEAYDRWMSNPFQLPLGVSMYNFLATSMSSNQAPMPTVAGPLFVSDGLNDHLVPGDIVSPTTGEKLISLDRVNVFHNQYLPYILLRLESWKGASTLSLCYNDACYNASEATAFLDDVVGYMMAIL